MRKLVLAGAPVDIAAGQSALSALAGASPLALFHELVKLGDGLVIGRSVQKFWGQETLSPHEIQQLLQTLEPVGTAAFAELEAKFRHWHAWTVDLPGTYYLEVIEKLYKRNEIARGQFIALGERIDLAKMRTPTFLLAARDDDLSRRRSYSPSSIWSALRRMRIAKRSRPAATADCSWDGQVLGEYWPRIARWMIEPDSRALAPAAASINRSPLKLAWPSLPTMMWSCTEMPSGFATSTIDCVIWMSARRRRRVARRMIVHQDHRGRR